MKFKGNLFALAAAITTVGLPGHAIAQSQGTQAQRSANLRATADLRARLGATEQRIAEGQRSGAITRARAAALRQQVAQTRASMTRLNRQQGFVSAAELASYNRTLGTIDGVLDRGGVARRNGHGMAVAGESGNQAPEFRYNCQNDPIAIAIPGDRLDNALDQLRIATHCPISGTELAKGKRSRPVVGTMTPIEALQAMLNGTGLQMRTLKGGFEILPLPR